MMLLRGDERVRRPCSFYRHIEPERRSVGRAKHSHVLTDSVRQRSTIVNIRAVVGVENMWRKQLAVVRNISSVARSHCNRTVRMPRYDPDRKFDFLAAGRNPYDIHFVDTAFVAGTHTELIRRAPAHQRSVVPHELRDGIGQFLAPSVVGKRTIENGRVRSDDELDASCCRLLNSVLAHARRRCTCDRSVTRVGKEAVMNDAAPSLIKRAADGILPGLPDEVVSGCTRLPRQQSE